MRYFVMGLVALTLAGCADEPPPAPPRHYTTPDYSYLPKIRLNVASVNVVERLPPPLPEDEATLAPTPPNQAIENMIHERLVAGGPSGDAIVNIDQASLLRDGNGVLNGTLAVHIDIVGYDGQQQGYVTARVMRSHVPASDNEDAASARYDLVSQLMNALNVELEFQIRNHLHSLILRNGFGGGHAVKTESLAPPPSSAPLSPPAQPDMSDTPPAPQDDQQMPPQQMSPPPGVLHLPNQ